MLPPRLLSGSVVSALGRALGTALSVVTIGIITRSLVATSGVAGYGSYAAIFAFLSALAVVADGGLYLVFTRAAARLDDESERRLLGVVLTVRLVALVVALGIVALAVVVARYPTIVQRGILLGSLGTAAQLMTQVMLGVFQKRLRMLSPATGEVCGRATTLALAWWSAQAGGGILQYVGAFVSGAFVTLLWSLMGVRRFLPSARTESSHTSPPASPAPLQKTREILRDAWPLGLLLICWLIVFRADSLLLSYLRPPQDLGWYALPYKILESLLFFPAMIGGLLFPILSQFSGSTTSDPGRLRAVLSAATSLFLILAIPTVGVLILGAPWILLVVGGPAFVPSIPILRILAVALGALFFGNLFGNGAIALGAQRPLLVVAGGLAALNVAVNLVVIPRYSFLGAAWTTLGTEFFSAVLAGSIVARRTPRFLFTTEHWHIISSGGILALLFFLPFPLLFRIVLGLAGYVGMLGVLGVLTRARLTLFLRPWGASPNTA